MITNIIMVFELAVILYLWRDNLNLAKYLKIAHQGFAKLTEILQDSEKKFDALNIKLSETEDALFKVQQTNAHYFAVINASTTEKPPIEAATDSTLPVEPPSASTNHPES